MKNTGGLTTIINISITLLPVCTKAKNSCNRPKVCRLCSLSRKLFKPINWRREINAFSISSFLIRKLNLLVTRETYHCLLSSSMNSLAEHITALLEGMLWCLGQSVALCLPQTCHTFAIQDSANTIWHQN